jgi:hypothetical protein
MNGVFCRPKHACACACADQLFYAEVVGDEIVFQGRAVSPRQMATAPSPTEAIQLAAKSMSEALQTALLLVDQSRRQAEQQVERRVPKHRRRDDQLADECLEN